MHIFAGAPLDRAAHFRDKSTWLESAWLDPTTRLAVLWQSKHCINLADPSEPRAHLISSHRMAAHFEEKLPRIFLGLDEKIAHFAVDLSSLNQRDAHTLCAGGEFAPLRQWGPLLPSKEAALLAYARGMLFWRKRHQFCGQCGSKHEIHAGGHMHRCSHPACGLTCFPRTDPAVIMLVEANFPSGPPKLLLGRGVDWPAGTYSTLAGFVEPGETLEEAVVREVAEEAGVHVSKVHYLASQPWPFPSSLMVGFHATATTTALTIDPSELAEADWFTPKMVRDYVEERERKGPAYAISHWLLRHWLRDKTAWL